MTEEKKSNKDLINLAGALTSSYITEYLENVFVNIWNRKENDCFVDIFRNNYEFGDYFVAVIVPLFTENLSDKINPFILNIFIIGMYYSFTAVINKIQKDEDVNGFEFVFDIIIDVIIIDFLFKIIDYFKCLLKNKNEKDDTKDKNKEDPKDKTQEDTKDKAKEDTKSKTNDELILEVFLENFPYDVIVSLHYSLKGKFYPTKKLLKFFRCT
jgi:hypothetical protein